MTLRRISAVIVAAAVLTACEGDSHPPGGPNAVPTTSAHSMLGPLTTEVADVLRDTLQKTGVEVTTVPGEVTVVVPSVDEIALARAGMRTDMWGVVEAAKMHHTREADGLVEGEGHGGLVQWSYDPAVGLRIVADVSNARIDRSR